MTTVDTVAVITGASGGIGSAVARLMAESGAHVVLNYFESASRLDPLRSDLEESGGSCDVIQGDISDPATSLRLAEAAADAGRPRVLVVHCAGIIARPADWESLSPRTVAQTFAVNSASALWLAQAFVPLMRGLGGGHIIYIGSTYAKGAAAVAAYSASKAALESITKSLAIDLGPSNVRVNMIAPGNIDTQMTRAAGEDIVSWVIETTPLDRLGRPDEVAEAAAYLDRADFITGHTLVLDGGHSLHT